MKKYDAYKPSGIDWIGQIPTHWKISKIKYAMNLINGRAYLQPELLPEGKYRILRVGNFFTNDSWYYSNMELEDNKYCEKGDLLYAWSASIGPYIWAEEKVIFHYHIWKVALANNMDLKYSYYILKYITNVKLNDMHGTAMQHLTMENMNNTSIILPPLSEQEGIAAWLDRKCGEIDAAIGKVDREIELIEELKQSEISRVVTRGLNPDAPLRHSGIDWIGQIPKHWKICRIKDCFYLKTGTTPKGFDRPINDDEINWFTPSDIDNNGTILTIAERKLSKRLIEQEGISLFPKRSLIFVGIGATAGKLGYAEIEGYSNQQITALIPKNICSKYYFYYLCQDTKRIRDNASYTTLPIINNSYLSQVYWLLPPLAEQEAIADYLDKKCAEIDALKMKLTKKRETLKELRQSIISEVVTGKRKVI